MVLGGSCRTQLRKPICKLSLTVLFTGMMIAHPQIQQWLLSMMMKSPNVLVKLRFVHVYVLPVSTIDKLTP